MNIFIQNGPGTQIDYRTTAEGKEQRDGVVRGTEERAHKNAGGTGTNQEESQESGTPIIHFSNNRKTKKKKQKQKKTGFFNINEITVSQDLYPLRM